MQRTGFVAMALWCAILAIALGGLGLLKGGFYADRYEGDMLHMLEIVFRLADGQWPHLDFMTPIGLLAFWPQALFIELGHGAGVAVLMAQVLVALAIAPFAAWVAASRFSGGWAFVYGGLVMVFCIALVHGLSDPYISMSMHYNRWAWALGFVALPVAMLPARGHRRVWADALCLGLPLAAIVLVKVTYIVALAPGIVLLLAVRRDWAVLGWGAAAGLGALAAFTLFSGPEYWVAYVSDLLATAGSEERARPGHALDQVLTAPLYLGGHILALTAVILLRQGGRPELGLGLLVLLPGFVFITYQNFGNDPQWMPLLGLVLFMALPAAGLRNGWGWDLRQGVRLVAAGLLALASPSVLNMAYSPMRHYFAPADDFARIFPRADRHGDFLTSGKRAFQVNMQFAGEEVVPAFAQYAPLAEREEPTVVLGETLDHCSLQNGVPVWFDAIARDLEAAGIVPGARIMTADLLSALWMYSDAMEPLEDGAPWRYGGLPGFADATHVLVPLCPISPPARADIMRQVAATGLALREVRRTPLYILLEKVPSPAG